MHLYDSMDSTTEEVLKIIEILAEEEDMKVTAFGTTKGMAILVAGALAGVAMVQPLAWGLFLGLVAGAITASLICWDKKSVAEVIANMPRERQIRLVEQILKTGIALGKLTPKIWLMGGPTPQSSTDNAEFEVEKEEVQDTVTLKDGRVVSRGELVKALRECLAKEGMSVSN